MRSPEMRRALSSIANRVATSCQPRLMLLLLGDRAHFQRKRYLAHARFSLLVRAIAFASHDRPVESENIFAKTYPSARAAPTHQAHSLERLSETLRQVSRR